MAYVFISFGPADRGYAAQLGEHLRASGVPVWLDEYSDLPGRWEQVGRDAIDGCAAFVVVMSPDSADSPNVAREIDHARATGRPLFPFLLLGPAFPALAGVPTIDVSDGRMPPPDRVVALRGLIGTTPPPSSPFPSSPYPSSTFPSSPFPPGPPTVVLPPGSLYSAGPAAPGVPDRSGLSVGGGPGSGPYLPGAAPVSSRRPRPEPAATRRPVRSGRAARAPDSGSWSAPDRSRSC